MRAHSGGDSEPAAVPPLAGFTVGVTAARRADELAALLEGHGATVLRAPVLRIVSLSDDAEVWSPDDLSPVDRLLDAVCARGLDAVSFTSAPAAASLLKRAERRGLLAELLGVLRRGEVLAACVGPVTALPLRALDVPTRQPEHFRLGPLVQLIASELAGRVRPLPVAGHLLEIRGQAALVDGGLRAVPPAGMALLRALSRRPGWVVSRADLLRALPGSGTDEHAVETAMARLRAALGAPKVIQTVVKRGYRLSVDPHANGTYAPGA